MTRTYVVVTAPNADYRVRDELVRLGHDVWLPECVHRRKVHRRGPALSVEGPLYPGYQFVALDDAVAAEGEIAAVRGCRGLLLRDLRPYAVPEEQMARIRRIYGGAPFIVICGGQVWREFAPGQRVKIEEGTFAGHDGVFVGKVSEALSQIGLDIFGRQTQTLVSTEALVPLPA